MKDNDIIKALECCKDRRCDICERQCNHFAYESICRLDLIEHALYLIIRLKAENERLQKRNEYRINYMGYFPKLERDNAIKEFAEKVKGIDLYQCIEEYYKNAELCYEVRQDWFCEQIDNLVKELTEGKNE